MSDSIFFNKALKTTIFARLEVSAARERIAFGVTEEFQSIVK